MTFFCKNAFKNKYVFLGGFPSGAAATHRRVFCLDFSEMFRLFGNVYVFFECLGLCLECLSFFGGMFGFVWGMFKLFLEC